MEREIAYYKDGTPYTTNGEPLIVITGDKPTSSATINNWWGKPGMSSGSSWDPKDDRMTHEWKGNFSAEDEVTKEELAEANKRAQERMKKLNEDLAIAKTVYTQNSASEKNNKVILDNKQRELNANSELLAKAGNSASKYILRDKGKLLYIDFLTSQINYFDSQAKRMSSDAVQTNLSAYLPLTTAAVVRQRISDAKTKNDEANKTFAKVTPLKNELKQKADEEAVDVKSAIKFSADFYKELTEKLGEQSSKVAQELAAAAKGKQIPNAEAAIKAFDKYKDVLNKKFSVKDREAIKKALASLNRDEMGKNFAKFSKAFKFVGNSVDVYDVAVEFQKATDTNNYRPFFIKLETLAAGRVATAITAFAFSLIVGTPMGILGFALIMTVVGVMVDEKLIAKVNKLVGI